MKIKLTLSIALILLSFQLTKAQEQFAIYFESNKSDLTNLENKRLQEWISLHRDSKIVAINGFADEDGTNHSNEVLAQKRVDFIFKKVNGKITIREDFKSISFGEQFSQTKNKAANRKVAIYYILAKDFIN